MKYLQGNAFVEVFNTIIWVLYNPNRNSRHLGYPSICPKRIYQVFRSSLLRVSTLYILSCSMLQMAIPIPQVKDTIPQCLQLLGT
ncbi:uncharacterized protein B0P05DRAFT_2712 [Gilbertella persicaria]|uniref:uncharacterized protein n=1 Tax=Gilbertella persicaria TaxID=101096 RepID=UPI002220E8DD|nr:uncharacterized protein B0P05DRAFT_2712 [Gilbertella persicaria]KAI8098189.1 hypothetical protein B0P05DRAFT_2712 [Gilbertella persicaria]